jgi:hypothetical protein
VRQKPLDQSHGKSNLNAIQFNRQTNTRPEAVMKTATEIGILSGGRENQPLPEGGANEFKYLKLSNDFHRSILVRNTPELDFITLPLGLWEKTGGKPQTLEYRSAGEQIHRAIYDQNRAGSAIGWKGCNQAI